MKRRSHRWIVWLLPFLVARAFVPTGFMLLAAAGELSLAFCPSAGPTAQFAALPEDASAHHDAQAHDPRLHGDDGNHHGQHAQHHSQGNTDQHSNHFGASDTGVCPFAVVASASSGSDFYAANARFDSTSDLLPSYTVPPDANRPIRADRIRGPPTPLSHG